MSKLKNVEGDLTAELDVVYPIERLTEPVYAASGNLWALMEEGDEEEEEGLEWDDDEEEELDEKGDDFEGFIIE